MKQHKPIFIMFEIDDFLLCMEISSGIFSNEPRAKRAYKMIKCDVTNTIEKEFKKHKIVNTTIPARVLFKLEEVRNVIRSGRLYSDREKFEALKKEHSNE